MFIKIKKLREEATVPTAGSKYAAGYDLYACLPKGDVTIAPHATAKIGTGLGLSIVKNILLQHGSRFGVSSEIGRGSTFWFEFKVVETARKLPDVSGFVLDTSPIGKTDQ